MEPRAPGAWVARWSRMVVLAPRAGGPLDAPGRVVDPFADLPGLFLTHTRAAYDDADLYALARAYNGPYGDAVSTSQPHALADPGSGHLGRRGQPLLPPRSSPLL